MFNKNEWLQWAQQSQNNNAEMKDFRHDYWRKNDATRSYLNQNNTVKENSQDKNEPVELIEGAIGDFAKWVAGTHRPHLRNKDGDVIKYPDKYPSHYEHGSKLGEPHPKAGKPLPKSKAGKPIKITTGKVWKNRGKIAGARGLDIGTQVVAFGGLRGQPKEPKQDVGQSSREFETESVELGQSMKLKFDKLKKVKDVHEVAPAIPAIAAAAGTVAATALPMLGMMAMSGKKKPLPPTAKMRANRIQPKPMHASYDPEGTELSILKERVRILKERVHNLQEQDLQELLAPLLGLLGRGAAMAKTGLGMAKTGLGMAKTGTPKALGGVRGAFRAPRNTGVRGGFRAPRNTGVRGGLTKKSTTSVSPVKKVPTKVNVKAGNAKAPTIDPNKQMVLSPKPKPTTAPRSTAPNTTGSAPPKSSTASTSKSAGNAAGKKVETKKSKFLKGTGNVLKQNLPLAVMMSMGGGGGTPPPTTADSVQNPTGTARNA